MSLLVAPVHGETMLEFLVLLMIFSDISAQVPYNRGVCPTKAPSTPIDLHQMTGQWYEIEASPTFLEYPFKCIDIKVPPFYEKVTEITIDAVNRMSKEIGTIQKITAKIPENSNEQDGKLILNLVPPSSPPEGELTYGSKLREMYEELPIQILATDYNNWAIAYMCRKHDKARAHYEFMWVLSRQRTLSEEHFEIVQKAKLSHHLEYIKTKDTIQSRCTKKEMEEEKMNEENWKEEI